MSLHQVELPAGVTSQIKIRATIPETASDFIKKVTAEIIAVRGDALPVSVLPSDGTFPTGSAAYEKRNLALEIPVWESDLCTQCGK